jgi:aspartate/methionine/tyrosine aminotransferase
MRQLRPFELEVFFSKWEFTTRYNLCASDMQSMKLSELLAMADEGDREAWDQLHLGYTETRGLPALREVIAETYDTVDPADILCFVGAEEGIFAAMHALLGPDDHFVTIIPNYQSAESVPLSICSVTGIALDPAKNWSLDLDELRDAIRPNTRMIYINFPHNPTGKVISRSDLDSIVAIAAEGGIYLFSDEVYRLIERRPDIRLPQAVDLYERGLSLGVMSKAYGLPGLRIGWIACRDHEVLDRMERVKYYTSICSPAPSELLAKIALKACDSILSRNRSLIDRNLAVLEGFFERYSDLFEWYLPDGGCVGYPRYVGDEGVEIFAADLVERAGVLILPASNYRSDLGPTPADRFRIGYGRANMAEALAAMAKTFDGMAARAVL